MIIRIQVSDSALINMRNNTITQGQEYSGQAFLVRYSDTSNLGHSFDNNIVVFYHNPSTISSCIWDELAGKLQMSQCALSPVSLDDFMNTSYAYRNSATSPYYFNTVSGTDLFIDIHTDTSSPNDFLDGFGAPLMAALCKGGWMEAHGASQTTSTGTSGRPMLPVAVRWSMGCIEVD